MAVSVTIAAIDRTSFCNFEKLVVTNTIVTAADVADLTISLPSGSTWRPQAGNEVKVINGSSTEFGGIIMEVSEKLAGPSRLIYSCSCRDYTDLFDRLVVVDTYVAQPASSIVSSIVSSYTSGFTVANVAAAPVVGKQVFDYVAPSQAIRGLADTIGYGFYVDYAKDVHFYNVANVVAPTTGINLDTNTTAYGGMVLTENIQQEKNRVYLKGFKQKSSATYSNTFTGDGVTRFFLLGYEPASSGDIVVKRNGVTQSFNTDQVDGQPGNDVGGANDYFTCYSNMGIRWDVPPAAGDSIVATYNYMSDMVLVMEDVVAQSTMATREGGTGIHEFAYDDPGLTAVNGTDALAQQKGTQLLARYAMPRFLGSFTSFLQGWKAGQVLTLSSTKRFGGFSKDMYVQQVRKVLVNHPAAGAPLLHYDIELADSALAL